MPIVLNDFSLQELTAYVTDNHMQPFVARQLYQWLQKGVDFDGMTNLSKQVRVQLSQNCVAVSAKIVRTLQSQEDDTQKFLFALHDGNVVEGVLMRYKHGNTLCVSCQVGCRMGCKFCASTLGGLVRNLSAGEILGQVLSVNALGDGKQRFVTNIVLMGSGEPLDNFDNVTKFIKLVSAPEGINVSERNISLSTCGIVPAMRQLADMGFSVNLTLSLHNAFTEQRKNIMPITNAYSVEDAIEACRYYFNKTGRRVYFEYTLIEGQNDSYAHALKLASAVQGMSAHVNVIPLNPVKESRLKAPSQVSLNKFLQYLQNLGVSATRRRTMGQDIEGACGQLRRKFIAEEQNG